MTSRERMLTALSGGRPDRLPVTIHQWQPYHLKKYMGGVSDIEACAMCGLDASINFYEAEEPASPSWRISASAAGCGGETRTLYTVDTPEGRLEWSEGSSPMTSWVSSCLIKNEDDIYLLKKYRPVPVSRL